MAPPRIFSPPWSLALGAALAFYPAFLPPASVLAAASLVAGLAIALARLGPPESPSWRLWAILALALGLGLVAGLGARLDGAGRSSSALAWAGKAGSDQGVDFLRVRGLGGRLAADARTTRGGYRLYPLELTRLDLEGEGVLASIDARVSLSLLVEGGPLLVAGDEVDASSPRILEEGLALCEADSFCGRASKEPLRRLRSILKEAWHRALDLAGGGGASSGLLVALLEGRRDGLDLEESGAFTKAGCVAVLSLSGQHLSILAAALALLLKPLGGPFRAQAGALVLAMLFVFVAGPEPALLRSLLMFGLSTLVLFLDRPQDGRTILGLSFVLQLALDPEAARGLSFCLSYLALAGLVLFSPRFEYLLLPALPPFLAKAAAASCAAFLPTLPLAGASFGAVYPVGLLASVVSAPLVAAYIWWGLGASCLCLALPPLAPLLCRPTLLIHGLLAATMGFFARAPGLPLGGQGLLLASASVVLILAFVYALPHVHHAQLRRAHGTQDPPRGRGPGHVQASRAEFPDQPGGQGAHPRGRHRPRRPVTPSRV